VDDIWATKSEDVGLIVRAISFQDFQPILCRHDPPTPVPDVPKNGPLVYFDDNFGKYGPILTIFHYYNKKFMHKN